MTLEGDWTGAAEILQFDASLTQADTRLVGSGVVGPTVESGADFPTLIMEIVGSYSHPVVELTWRQASGAPAYRFTGQLVTPIRIEGVVTSGSERSVPLILHRPQAAASYLVP